MKTKSLLFSALLAGMLTSCSQVNVDLSWVPSDVQYTPESVLPVTTVTTQTLKAWRGERVSAQALLTLQDSLADAVALTVDATLPSAEWGNTVGWVREVITNDYRTCGTPPDTLPTYLVADRIDPGTVLSAAYGRTYSLWCSVDVPRDAAVGTYPIDCQIKSGNTTVATLTLNVEVIDRTLPEVKDYKFHLNLWQQPYSVSRFYHVEPWSDAHFELLRPYMQELAKAGQKVVSAILFYEPWGEQSNDKFEPMVETILNADGTWSYDYTVFDKYVKFMEECGISAQIDCYSMVPWDMSFRYRDAATNEYKFLTCRTSDPAYRNLWNPFLKAFAAHLKEMGWFDKTCIAMDERGLSDMLNAYKVAQEAVPGIKMSLAGVYHAELVDLLQYYCLTYKQEFPAEALAQRKSRQQLSTSYTCCVDAYPSLFSNAAPAECEFIPLTCIARGFDGFLHWSWLNWTDDPVNDTRFKFFAPGDTYFYYPDNCPSIHWERFLEGVQQCEKIELLGRYDLLDGWDKVDASDATSITSFLQTVRRGLNEK